LLDALRSVPGVAAANLEADDRTDGAGTLRLQLTPGADEVQVATSVNRVLREQFGLAVDANRVQVVEESVPIRPASATADDLLSNDSPSTPRPALSAVPDLPPAPDLLAGPQHLGDDLPAADADPSAPAGSIATALTAPLETEPRTTWETTEDADAAAVADSAERAPRVLIQRMQLVSAGLGVSTEVTLTWHGSPFQGESAAAATPTSVHRSVAQATLHAVEAVVGGRARFELEQLEINQLGADRAVIVVVSMLTSLGSERLTGVSAVREDVRQAVIRATLDSLNRRLETILLSA
jgi:hypothetical protein